jgi:hypothetical protein
MEDHSWYREPPGDYVEAFDSKESPGVDVPKGYAKGFE